MFADQYRKMISGQHPLGVGKAYDAERDSIITLDPMTGKATSVQDWDGTVWPEAEVEKIYPGPLTFDFMNMVAVGDGWWIPCVAGGHFGVDPKDIYQAYNETMDYMATDEFQFVKASGLREALLHLAESKPLVLVTNSGEKDAQRLLQELGLDDAFTQKVCSAEKPAHTTEVFESLMARFNAVPEKTVAVGDNFINEIAPALSLGMKAVHIQPYGGAEAKENLLPVKSLEEVL
ncbi:MAG TPA: HAD family hydrolase [Bacillales bacterium]